MNFLKKHIKFYCSLPEVQEQYPIIPSKSYKFDWVKSSAKAFKDLTNELGDFQQISGTARCGGISNIMNKGFIIRSWFDLTIKTSKNSNEFEYFVPEGIYSYLNEKNFNKNIISWFSTNNPAHSVPISSNDFKSLIKIHTPWTVSIPSNWSLCFLPIPYSDNPNFSATSGILESGDKHDISVIIKIHEWPGKIHIPAGTPLCQFLPIRNETVPIKFLNLDSDMEKINLKHQYKRNHSFITKY